jgi:competence protein ComEC
MQSFISFIAGVVLFYACPYFPCLTVTLALSSCIALALKRKFPAILILVAGIAFAFMRYEPLQDVPSIRDTISFQGVFETYPTKTEQGMFKQSLRIHTAANMKTGEKLHALAGQKIFLLSDRAFYPGTDCEGTALLLGGNTRLNPGARNNNHRFAIMVNLMHAKEGRITLNSLIQNYRYRLHRFIDANFSRDSGSLLKAITLNQKAEIDYDLRNAFNKTGLAHILSISGTHFGLFSMFLFGFFNLITKALPYRILQRLTIFLSPSQAAVILCLPFMIAYLGLSGASIPAVRSFIMIGLFMIGLLMGRKAFWLNSLFFAAFLLILLDPKTIFSLAFQLSFIAVLFIGFAIAHTRHEQEGDKKSLRYVKNVLVITLAASIGTAPLVAYHFHYLSLISPVANVIVAPLVGFILIPLSVVSAFLFLMTGHFMLTPVVSGLTDLIVCLVTWFAHIPFADIKIPSFPPVIMLFFYTGFIFYFLFQKKRYTLVIPFIPLLIYLSFTVIEKSASSITYLDVGQGDSSVIELPDGKTMVIDTGKTGYETASFLSYKGKTVIDALILSHIHPDHTGGLHYLIRRFKVRELWTPERLAIPETLCHIKQRRLSRGDLVEGRGYRIYVFHPYTEFYTMDGNEYVAENNDSLVLKFMMHQKSFLFTGDVEEEAEEDIVHLGMWLQSNVLKVPHHGGKSSSSRHFIDAVTPDIAVISVGRDNPFGHPHDEMLHALQKARLFRTDTDGAVTIRNSSKGLACRTYREFQFTTARSFTDELKNVKRLFETW